MRNSFIVGSFALVALVWTGVGAQQETQPRPGPGSGVTPVSGNVRVSGTVSVDALPDVHAKQRGDWGVEITAMPNVRVDGPSFVKKGGRYRITWTNGDEDTVTVTTPGLDGWVQSATGPWLNLRNARSVQALD